MEHIIVNCPHTHSVNQQFTFTYTPTLHISLNNNNVVTKQALPFIQSVSHSPKFRSLPVHQAAFHFTPLTSYHNNWHTHTRNHRLFSISIHNTQLDDPLVSKHGDLAGHSFIDTLLLVLWSTPFYLGSQQTAWWSTSEPTWWSRHTYSITNTDIYICTVGLSVEQAYLINMVFDVSICLFQ